MTRAESKIRFLLLIDISSVGCCTKSDQELALEADTTIPFVNTVLREMEKKREIVMAFVENQRQILYPKKVKLF